MPVYGIPERSSLCSIDHWYHGLSCYCPHISY